MAKTAGATVNTALREVGEVDITVFESEDQLQNILLDDMNEVVHDILEAARYRWGLQRDYLTTVADQTDGGVLVTNGSTTVTSAVLGEATAADNFGSTIAGQFLRLSRDKTSYRIASVDTSSSPDTLVLEDAYVGETEATESLGFKIVQDTYALTFSDIDEIILASYGESSAIFGSDEIALTDIQTLKKRAAHDLHRDTTGKPLMMAHVGINSSDQEEWVFWPYPDKAFLFELFFTTKFTSNTTFSTSVFGGDAPDIAYDAVSHHLRWRACMYDEDYNKADRWMAAYERARFQIVARENRTQRNERQLDVKTYRQHNLRRHRGFQGVSQIAFDRIPSIR